MEEVIQISDHWYIKADSSKADLQTRVLKDGESFAIFDRFGDIQCIGIGDQGIFHEGTRYLSQLEMMINNRRPLLLNSSTSHDNTLLVIDLTTPDLYDGSQLVIGKGKLHIFRSKFLWNEHYYEHIRLTNYWEKDFSIDVSFSINSDYADIFEIRGWKRNKRGTMQQLQYGKNKIGLGYKGLDKVFYQTEVIFEPSPGPITGNEIHYPLSINSQESKDIYLRVFCSKDNQKKKPLTFAKAFKESREKSRTARTDFVEAVSSNEQLNEWLERSAADLQLLITDTGRGIYPYAGIPWFCTPFGRDGIITALQCLWIYPDLAQGVLKYLAHHQATENLPGNDEEPGKILHETRKGEMAFLREIPFSKYYGTVDATPLFIVLAGRYFERTGDLQFIKKIWPNLLAALDWIKNYGDIDNDGFVEYIRKCEQGILQQGWKDSDDSVFHEDGRNAEGPIALCEVQGYVYEAKMQMSRLADILGHTTLSQPLEEEALILKEQFHKRFWVEDIGTYAIALDGDKKPCKIRSSNAGHTLFSNIAKKDCAKTLVKTLLSDKSFSDWGVRTVAAGETRYNPMSYHNGSVWPHDNALIAMGMAQYGFKAEASCILTGLFHAAIAIDLYRLPELFCGFHRRKGQKPTLYPVACAPQAWASGALFMMLQACMGLNFSHKKPEICFNRPYLPDYIDSIRLMNLRAGDGEVDLVLRRNFNETSVHVIRKKGNIEISVVM
jgi:glycogen debranching enzyme